MSDFENLFIENRDLIFRYLLKLSNNESLATELTQETFFRAYINFNSLRSRDYASAWLYIIARNVYFSWYKEQKKLTPLEKIQEIPDPETPEALLMKKELSDNALACLDALNEPYKEVFNLSVFGGLSLKEISMLFGKSESWARVTFYRAKQKLSESLRDRYGM